MTVSSSNGNKQKTKFFKPQSDNKMVFVTLTTEFDHEFIGLDGRVYGPFDQGDVVRVPADQADVLRSNGIIK